MPRYLTMQRSIVPSGDREGFRQKMKERKAHFERSDCRAWSFEEVGLAGAIIEFVESDNEQALVKAVRTAPGASQENARIYKELEQN